MQQAPNNQDGGWTLTTLHYHWQCLRAADKELQAERDRRNTEVAAEREKALRIKEQGDRDALELARSIQSYKDEKANELREQISRERGHYASKDDLRAAIEKIEVTLAPVVSYVATQQGVTGGKLSQQQMVGWVLGGIVALITIIGAVVAVAYAIRK